MVVEDDFIIADDIKESLISLGYAVCAIVSSGEQAIEKAAENKPDLVLMDIVLEGKVNGIEAADQIHSRFNIPVVYLTAYADAKTLERAKITEPYGYILKPYEDRELHSVIEIALYKHKMEKKLKESEEWLFTTLKSIGDAVIATDAEGRVKFMNLVAQDLLGWKPKDATGKPLQDIFNIVNEETGEQVENPVARVIREGIVVGLANHSVLIAKDGTKKPIADSGAPIKDDKGNIIGVVLVFRDITEQRKMEQELQKIQKLESIGILAGGIAHDFNNILTAILGNISIAKIKANPKDEIYARLVEAEKASLQAKDLTQQLLTFSKGGAPIKKTESITELIKDSAEFALRGSNVKCEFFIPDDIWPVEIDKGQISQVINNLIINADQAMLGGGIIKVRVENVAPVGAMRPCQAVAEHALPIKEGKYVKIEIEDEGIGIPKEHLSKIFDPYFTTKQKGSGLGLATSHSIIKRHDGYIAVESELGVGTTFYIYLPASSKQIFSTKEFEERPVLGKGRILVIDDEEAVRNVAGSMLKHIGYEVEFAKDGVEALELYQKAEASGQPYDAVIVDLTIPGGMGGEQVIKKLLEIDPNVKAIVSSGYSTDAIMSNFKQYGFSGVVTKPYRIAELGETLSKVIKG
ncbi:response regulator [Candidatus Poribacteria bacterium]|nr:response regulator [Candidatus Poribacteria bacterium]